MTCFAGGETGLLQRFRDGERAALEAVYKAYVNSVARSVAGAMRSYCDRCSGGWRVAATELPDLVQEVFARAFEPRARRRFDGIREYGPYLSQIARNTVVDHLRRTQRQVTRDPEQFAVVQISWHLAPNGAGDEFADLQIMALVGEYVARLPADLRLVHEALYVEGLSQREAAARLGLGRQVVRTLASRLSEGLRNTLKEMEGLEVSDAIVVHASAFASEKQKVEGSR